MFARQDWWLEDSLNKLLAKNIQEAVSRTERRIDFRGDMGKNNFQKRDLHCLRFQTTWQYICYRIQYMHSLVRGCVQPPQAPLLMRSCQCCSKRQCLLPCHTSSRCNGNSRVHTVLPDCYHSTAQPARVDCSSCKDPLATTKAMLRNGYSVWPSDAYFQFPIWLQDTMRRQNTWRALTMLRRYVAENALHCASNGVCLSVQSQQVLHIRIRDSIVYWLVVEIEAL